MIDCRMLLTGQTNLKTLRMKTEWERKVATGEVTAKRDQYIQGTGEVESEEDQLRLERIRSKLQCGSKLTETERNYLKTKDPKAYADLVREEEEQKAYERALRQCRTKEEVQRMKLHRMGRALETVKAAERDSSLSKEEKLKVVTYELRQVQHTFKSTQEFMNSWEYKRLPSEKHARVIVLPTEKEVRRELDEYIERILGNARDTGSKADPENQTDKK